jgi:hypothetical protein
MQAILIIALSLLMALSGLNLASGAAARDLQSLGMGHVHKKTNSFSKSIRIPLSDSGAVG